MMGHRVDASLASLAADLEGISSGKVCIGAWSDWLQGSAPSQRSDKVGNKGEGDLMVCYCRKTVHIPTHLLRL